MSEPDSPNAGKEDICMSSRPVIRALKVVANYITSLQGLRVRFIQANWKEYTVAAAGGWVAAVVVSPSSPPHAARISKNMPNKIGITNFRSVFLELLLSA